METAELRNAVNQEVTGRSAKDLAKVVEGLSARYRSSLQEPATVGLCRLLTMPSPARPFGCLPLMGQFTEP